MTLFCVYSLTLFNKFRQSPQNITTAKGGGFSRRNKNLLNNIFRIGVIFKHPLHAAKENRMIRVVYFVKGSFIFAGNKPE